MYPKITIHTDYYRHNVKHVLSQLKEKKIDLMPVTKVFGADQKLMDVLNEFDLEYVADSRIKNLKKMKTQHKKALLRLPQKSEIKEVVKYADLSFISSIETVLLLNTVAKKIQKKHHVILMFDIGDLREGIYYQNQYLPLVEKILSLDHIVLEGIGTNVTCYGGVIPTFETMQKLSNIKKKIEDTFNIQLKHISGGNSSIYPMIIDNDYPKDINFLRLGELLILGRETSYGKLIEPLYDNVITLSAQLIEVELKPSKPEGLLGVDAFGKKAVFYDKGVIARGILALGRQDVDPNYLICPTGVTILGSSSDHLIVEFLPNHTYKVGDVITFKLTYGGILSVMQSRYIRRTYVT